MTSSRFQVLKSSNIEEDAPRFEIWLDDKHLLMDLTMGPNNEIVCSSFQNGTSHQFPAEELLKALSKAYELVRKAD